MISREQARKNPLALVVDDDNSLRMVMGAALRKVGFDVIHAEDGQRGLALFQSDLPDLILLDVVMPVMDGFEACAAIRKLPEGIYTQILMVTGLDDTDSINRAFDVGADGFVTKPLNPVMLGHRGRYMLRAGQAFRELYRSRNRLDKTQKLAKLGNWQVDLATREFYCSREACTLLALRNGCERTTYEEFLAQVIPSDRDRVRDAIDAAVEEKKPVSLEYITLLPDGAQKHILNQGEILFDANGAPETLLGVIQDVSQLKEAEEEIRLLAFYDGLTGLANRMLFLDRLDHTIARAKRNNEIFAILYLDLDRFKRVNDTLGHHVGDLLLKNVAETLKKNIRRSDTVTRFRSEDSDSVIARLGGDEFTVLLTDIRDTESAAMVARRLIQAIPATYNCDGHDVSVTTSIGISLYPQDGQNATALLKNADSAMYQAKDSGRNNYQFYEESLNRVAIQRFSIENDMRKALDREEFELFYQPQIDLATRKIVGAEALIRWFHPEKGKIVPDDFISIAEESGLIIDINRWVLRKACGQWNDWRKAGLSPPRIAVNLSGYRFAHQNIIESIEDIIRSGSIDGHNLEVEITENVLMQDTVETITTLKQMKALGIVMTLDDFGTGYSSLRYLTSFPFDAIKIDRSFVMECTEQEDKYVIVRTIVAMGHSLEKRIVAEGIETKEQFELIRGCGCDEAQGYYFSPAVASDEFPALLEKGTL